MIKLAQTIATFLLAVALTDSTPMLTPACQASVKKACDCCGDDAECFCCAAPTPTQPQPAPATSTSNDSTFNAGMAAPSVFIFFHAPTSTPVGSHGLDAAIAPEAVPLFMLTHAFLI